MPTENPRAAKAVRTKGAGRAGQSCCPACGAMMGPGAAECPRCRFSPARNRRTSRQFRVFWITSVLVMAAGFLLAVYIAGMVQPR